MAYTQDYLGFLASLADVVQTDFSLNPSWIDSQILPRHILALQTEQPPANSAGRMGDQGVDIPMEGQPTSSQFRPIETFGCRSLRCNGEFMRKLLQQPWQWQTHRDRVIDDVRVPIFQCFTSLLNMGPDKNIKVGNLVKNMPLFVKYIENLAHLLNVVASLIRNPSNVDFLTQKMDDIVKFFIKIQLNLPKHCTDLRASILQNFYNFQENIFKYQINPGHNPPQGQGYQSLFVEARRAMNFYFDHLIDEKTLIGTGSISVHIIQFSSNIVHQLILQDTRRQEGVTCTEIQLVKAIQVLLYLILNPMCPLIQKSTIVIYLNKLNQELQQRRVATVQTPGGQTISIYDLQVEVLHSMVQICKQLREQITQGIEYFAQNEEAGQDDDDSPAPKDSASTNLGFGFEKEINTFPALDDVFQMKEREIVDACNQSFLMSWRNICSWQDTQRTNNASTTAKKRDFFPRIVKNLMLHVHAIITLLQEVTKKSIVEETILRIVKRFLTHSCYLIRSLHEFHSDESKLRDVCASFQIILLRFKVSQQRDLLLGIGDVLFGLIVEEKAKGINGGTTQLVSLLMTSTQNQTTWQKNQDELVTHFRELFFEYIKVKSRIFDISREAEKHKIDFLMSPQDRRLATLPFRDIQDALQSLILQIGEQTFAKSQDNLKVKHTFFTIFVFCIQTIRSGQIVPKYFDIVRNLLKDICNMDETQGVVKEIMRDFIPMFQGILETFLQAKQEATYVKETNEICCLMPAKLKHLLDLLPAILAPLIDSMDSSLTEQVASGIHTIQYWLSALAHFPELLDPIITQILPDLNQSLKHLLNFMPNLSLKLLGKLGAKSRQYDINNEFKPRNYSEDGLKVVLRDKHSQKTIVLGIDAIVDVLLVKIISFGDMYSSQDLNQAINFVRCAFLCYIDPNLDLDFIIATIIASKDRNTVPNQDYFERLGIKAPTFAFNAKQKQITVNQMSRGSESHVFEKILRCLIIGCSSLPKNTPEQAKVQKKHINFMKWVTKYFTLIYVVKNGNLSQTQVDEINPSIFVEYICEFLYQNIIQSIQKKQDVPYYKGSEVSIRTLLGTLKDLYGDTPDVFDELEVVKLLIKKICHQVQDPPKNLAVNIALKILISELPLSTLLKNVLLILKTLFQIINYSSDSVVLTIQKNIVPTFDQLFDRINIYAKVKDIVDVTICSETPESALILQVLDALLQNLLADQKVARDVTIFFLEKIALQSKVTVHEILAIVPKSSKQTPNFQTQGQRAQQDATMTQERAQPDSWLVHLLEQEVERRAPYIFEMFKGSYSQVQQLVAWLELVQFVLKHVDPARIKERDHVYLGISDCLVLTLEDECERFEAMIENSEITHQTGPSAMLAKIAKRYMKLERSYLTQNKEFDAYSHTMHSHQFLISHHFEVSHEAKEFKMKKEMEKIVQKQSNIGWKIYKENASWKFGSLSDQAVEKLAQDELQESFSVAKQRVIDFKSAIFGPHSVQLQAGQAGLRISDIRQDYIHDMFEMYPNVRLHCGLICKVMDVLCDIFTHKDLLEDLKQKQVEFFELLSNGNPEQQESPGQGLKSLQTRYDFYAVEIKSKVICLFLKFFIRDERNIQQVSKKCLKKLMQQDHQQYSYKALPNFILSDFLRPFLQQRNSSRQAFYHFQHLGKIVKVLNSCLQNQKMWFFLKDRFQCIVREIKEPYLTPNHAPSTEAGADSMPPNLMQAQQNEDIASLIEQYNLKVMSIETAVELLSSCHYLSTSHPNSREVLQLTDIVEETLLLQEVLIHHFDITFEEKLKSVLRDEESYYHRFPEVLNRLSPIQVRVGYLQSDFTAAVVRFFNQSYSEHLIKSFFSLASTNMSDPRHKTLIHILKQKESFCLRERLQREHERMIHQQIFTYRRNPILVDNGTAFNTKFVRCIDFIYVLSKFQPNYLIQAKNTQILDALREKWIQKSFPAKVLNTENRKLYSKIQKCLVNYCKIEQGEIQILFDLLKDMQLSSVYLDMKPLIQLCTVYIPQQATDGRKAKILETALNKIKLSKALMKAKYAMFEFAFMPIALQCARNKILFNEIFTEKIIRSFIDTFFALEKVNPNADLEERWTPLHYWKRIKIDLESQSQLSYQSFYLEIVKVLIIILMQVPNFDYFLSCCIQQQSEIGVIIKFLDQVVKTATDASLKEHALFALTTIGISMLGLEQGKDLPFKITGGETTKFYQQSQLCQDLFRNFLSIMTSNVLAPFYEYDLQKSQSKAIVQATFVNLVRIFRNPVVTNVIGSQDSIWTYFTRWFSMKTHLQTRLSFCSLVTKNEALCITQDPDIYRRLFKCVQMFIEMFQINTMNAVVQDISDCSEPLRLIKTLLIWLESELALRQLTMAVTTTQAAVDQTNKKIFQLYMQAVSLFELQLQNFALIEIQVSAGKLSLYQSKLSAQKFKVFAENCFSIIQSISRLQPNIVESFPPEDKQSEKYFSDVEKQTSTYLSMKAVLQLNVCSLAMHRGVPAQNILLLLKFLQNSYNPRLLTTEQRSTYANLTQQRQQVSIAYTTPLNRFSEVNYKLIMFSVHLICKVIRERDRLADQRLLQSLQKCLKEAVRYEIDKAIERDLTRIQGHIFNEFWRTSQNQRPQFPQTGTVLENQQQTYLQHKKDEIKYVQRILPHFSIRLVSRLEQLRDEGVLSEAEFNQWVDSNVYKEINNAINKLVSAFRIVIAQDVLNGKEGSKDKPKTNDKPEASDKSQEESSFDKSLSEEVETEFVTYQNIGFEENLMDFDLKEPTYEMWIKETIVLGLKSVVLHMKTNMHQDEAYLLFEPLKQTLKAFQSFRTDQYLFEQLYELTKLIITDYPNQKVKFIAEEKARQIWRLLLTERFKELGRDNQRFKDLGSDKSSPNNSLVNKVYGLCLDFLESQPNLLQNECSVRIFDKLLALKPYCNFETRLRCYRLFERFNGASLRAKLHYFFGRLIMDDLESFRTVSQINHLLDFTLLNFHQKVKLTQIKESSNLKRLSSPLVEFEGSDVIGQTEEGRRIQKSLCTFVTKYNKYRNKQLIDMLEPLSEIIRMNPEHSHDKRIAEIIFNKVFWQYWHILDRQDQQYLADGFNKLFLNIIKFQNEMQPQVRNQFARTMLEQVVALREPQVRIEPEILQYLGKHFNLWHVAIPQLEDHLSLYPQNERYFHALQELYAGLLEEDLQAGLMRVTTKSAEIRTMVTFGQHHCWEQLNKQFGHYINFYAEQEGLFTQLEQQQRMPGKYSRQLSKNSLLQMMRDQDPFIEQKDQVNNLFKDLFENNETAAKLGSEKFPKKGSNVAISEIDLRCWENFYMHSLKVLKKMELYRDVAENIASQEMKIDYFWAVKDFESLKTSLSPILQAQPQHSQDNNSYLPNSSFTKIKYHLYFNYILLHQNDPNGQNFDDNFRTTIRLAISQFNENLPSYMDRIHFEYLIMFQKIMESNEGGRSMQNYQESNKHENYRQAMNIWRARMPHHYESITTWQEILENRNCNLRKLNSNFILARVQEQGVRSVQDLCISPGRLEEPIDIVWNNLKLASVSRKHGYLGLANHYLNLVKDTLTDRETTGDLLKVERFKFAYESFKLKQSQPDSILQLEQLMSSLKFVENPDYESWMHAKMWRLQGEFFMQSGNLAQAKTKLLASIMNNTKEAKTWKVYAQLNELVFESKQDRQSIQNALKGYLCAVTLSQHKARLIIPSILKLLKVKSQQGNVALKNFLRDNVYEMPAWLWLFWIPQLLQFLKLPPDSLAHQTAYFMYLKLSKFYPQPSYYPLKAFNFYQRTVFQENNNLKKLLQNLPKYLRARNPKLQQEIENMMIEFYLVTRVGPDERFLGSLFQVLNFSQFFVQQDVEGQVRQFLENRYKEFLESSFNVLTAPAQGPATEETRNDQVKKRIAAEFYKYFIDPNTRETDILTQMQILKNIKDFVLVQRNLKEQQSHTEDVFPYIANMQVKGLELPGQHVLNANEPLPEKVIMIEKFESAVYRTGLNEKKIQIKCNNGKSYSFAIQPNNPTAPQEYDKFCSEERVTQLKVISNMIFAKEKESMRRGVKYIASQRILLMGVKLVQDDLTFSDFQETHDYLLQERNLDPDLPLTMQIEQVRQLFASYPPNKPRVMRSIEPETAKQINAATYEQMLKEVQPHLLTSYFNRIFYNVDHLFIFKKQFTKYHAANSLFAYIFNQSENLSLNALSFCKASGRVNFADAKLKQAISTSAAFKRQTIEQTEDDNFRVKPRAEGEQSEINLKYLPFRLTPNLEFFIGRIGVQGLFAGVITSAALALVSQNQQFKTLLQLLFADEIEKEEDRTDEIISKNADLVIYKCKSLCENPRFLQQTPKSDESKQMKVEIPPNASNIAFNEAKDSFSMGTKKTNVPRKYFDLEMERPVIQEEFNKKVFALIEMATEDTRRSQKPLNWSPWF